MVLITIFTQLIKLTISQKLKRLQDKLQDHLIMWSDQAAANGSRLI